MKMCKYLYIVSRLFAIFALRIINGRMERLGIMSIWDLKTNSFGVTH